MSIAEVSVTSGSEAVSDRKKDIWGGAGASAYRYDNLIASLRRRGGLEMSVSAPVSRHAMIDLGSVRE
jgi:hypothetical protein